MSDAPTIETIMEAVKLIAATNPKPIEPFSAINMGGVKLISAPHLQDDTIIISDNIYSKLAALHE